MDATHFDRWTQTLATVKAPRRHALSALLLSPIMSRLGIVDSEARKRKKRKKKCKGGTKKCGKKCRDLLTDSANCGACGNNCGKFPCVHGACGCERLECPPGCNCTLRKEGGAACAGGGVNVPCDVDADCPPGSFCIVTNVCSAPCLSNAG